MKDEKDFEGLEKKQTDADRSPLRQRFLRPVDTANELKHLLWQELKLSKLIGGWIPAIPVYEQKMTLGRYAYLHNRNVKCLYERIQELPGGLGEKEWIPDLTNEAMERIFAAPDEKTFFLSYHFVLKKLYEQYDALMLRLDPILNLPTIDQITFIFVERETMLGWVWRQVQFASSNSEEETLLMMEWESYISAVWQAFETNARHQSGADAIIWPVTIAKNPAGPLPEKAKLEPRFPRYQGEKPIQSYSDSSMSVLHDSVKQMIYIYATEIFAGETLSTIYYYVDHMPLPFYFDMARHMWDEFRHSQMGMRRLEQLGYTVDQFKWLTGPGKDDVKQQFTELYSSLTMLGEACGFKKKRKSAEAFWKFGDVLSAVTVEFDLIDERRHIDFGTRWGPELYKKIDVIISFQEMAEKARMRRLTELETVPPEEIAKLAKNFPVFCGFHTSELAYNNY
ncbi:ferritin-like domain-containing protein [Paenibacillus hamazuiensis]|uniref:ferritin-like domain-containing protein n=1 Tax=Paenibacillus hamazuiensis TaxID=2936508 RepID=UPI00200D1CFA|nr:ferritin-like domain-containing protein [Paenibacillus hamazuiensis]